MIFSHPLSKYGLAYVFLEEDIDTIDKITPQMLAKYLREGLNHFRLFTDGNPAVDEKLNFGYLSMQYIIDNNQKGDPSKGIYLSPNIITTDKQAANCWVAVKGLIDELSAINDQAELLRKRKDLTQSLAPISGKINNGSTSQTTPQASLLEVACCAIATITPEKPCKLIELSPVAIIPDLEVKKMIDFIRIFKRMKSTQTSELMKAKVLKNVKQGNKKNETKDKVTKEQFKRPPIVNGNFPDSPPNDFFGGLALLGAIGKWANSAENSSKGLAVLESLKDVPVYTIQHGDATVYEFSHFAIDLAKQNKLSEIIYSLLKTKIHSEEFRSYDNTKYKLFDFLSSRFLQFFNKPALKDFLSIRAEYQNDLKILFTSYFKDMAKIRPEIVESAKELGLWLNYVAYKTAQEECKNKPDKLSEFKSKFLVEMESAVFGAKTNTALFSVITRAGRLSGKDAPAEAHEFIKAISAEDIPLEDGKNLIMAYMRLKNRYEPKTEDNQKTSTEVSQSNNSIIIDAQH